MFEFVRRLLRFLIQSNGLTHGVLPTSADTVAAAAITLTSSGLATAYGLWAEIVSAANNGADRLIWGATLENWTNPGGNVVLGTVVNEGSIQIGIGAGGAEVMHARFPISSELVIFPKPVLIQGGNRIAARFQSANGANSVDIKLLDITGF